MKRVCVISANCQGAYIKALLESHQQFSADFDCSYFVNYEKQEVPASLLQNCDLLIYQPLSDKWGAVSDSYLSSMVPEKCRKFRVNYLTFPVYWPFQTHDPRNKPDRSFPFGQFPYGDSYILGMLDAGMSGEEVYNKLFDKDAVLAAINLDRVIEDYRVAQQDIEGRRDQRLLEFILDNYRKEKLFETFNHPARVLCVHQVNDLLEQLGYPNLPEDTLDLKYLMSNQQPIMPAIAGVLGLEFGAEWSHIYNIWNKPMTAEEYFRAYINWDVSAIGKAVEVAEVDMLDISESEEEAQVTMSEDKKSPEVVSGQLLFIHIPKTGGTSLNEMLAEAVLGTKQFVHYNSTAYLVKDLKRRDCPLVMGHVHYDSHKILSKNCKIFTFLRDPVDRVISSFEFMKSHPETWLGKLAQGSLQEFLGDSYVAKSFADLQTRLLGVDINFLKFYADLKNGRITEEQYYNAINQSAQKSVDDEDLERAKERLAGMLFFGFTDTFSGDVVKLFAKLGYPCPEIRQSNRTPDKFRKRDKYSEEDIKLIKALNQYDVQLYEFAKKLRAERELESQ